MAYGKFPTLIACCAAICGVASAAAQDRPAKEQSGRATSTSDLETELTPYEWKARQRVAFEQSEKVYAGAMKRDGLLAQYHAMHVAYQGDKDAAFRIVFGQYLSWYQSFIGDYPGAQASYTIKQVPAKDDSDSPLTAGYTVQPALDAVAKLAHGRKAIFLNEAHNVPLTRTLTVQLLPKLRADGYTWFAAETLYAADTELQKRGYPTAKSGFYTNEPILGEMVRTALKLGFKVVPYESSDEVAGDKREYQQARNLIDRVFKQDPDARLVVDAGYAHIQETGRFLGGRSMAEHFHMLSHVDPLTIEQTMMIEHPRRAEDHPIYDAVIEKLHPVGPIVFVGKSGDPWSLKAKAYDASVFFPHDVLRDGRPTWATLGGLRVSYYVGKELCSDRFPCLIEARYVDEGDDAIPADRLVIDRIDKLKVESGSELYLRPGRYRLTATDVDNQVVTRRNITVGASGGKTP
ncbi:MAG TPA: hypothetical protein VFG55_04130 [Rhodanobacteraceae bacterium]|nr:hypothetical protein [Rhodanobacteraceae bacterium]